MQVYIQKNTLTIYVCIHGLKEEKRKIDAITTSALASKRSDYAFASNAYDSLTPDNTTSLHALSMFWERLERSWGSFSLKPTFSRWFLRH